MFKCLFLAEGIHSINKGGQSLGARSDASEVNADSQPTRSTTTVGLDHDVENSSRIVLPSWKEAGHFPLTSSQKEARKAPAGFNSLASKSGEGGSKRKRTDSHLGRDRIHHIPQGTPYASL